MINQNNYKPPVRRFWYILIIAIIVIASIFQFIKIIEKREKLSEEKKKIGQPASKELQDQDRIVSQIDPDNPPKFIQADIVELDKIYSISKLRSGVGHDFSVLSGETCRSMKHYFSSMDSNQPVYKYEVLREEEMPKPTIEKDVKLFSPVDGVLTINEKWAFSVSPDSYPEININFGHVTAAPNLKNGKVKAGQFIGLVLANQSFDLDIQVDLTDKNGEKRIGYISYFAAMPENVFENYRKRGARDPSDFIITREYRDAHPYSCHGKEVFDKYYFGIEPRNVNVFDLSGYAEVDKKIREKYPNPNVVETVNTIKLE